MSKPSQLPATQPEYLANFREAEHHLYLRRSQKVSPNFLPTGQKIWRKPFESAACTSFYKLRIIFMVCFNPKAGYEEEVGDNGNLSLSLQSTLASKYV